MTTTEQSNGQALQKSDNKTAGNKIALRQILDAREQEIKRLVGSIMSPQRLISLAVLAVGGNEYLGKCSLSSVVKSVLDAARMGLELDGQNAALVPMWSTKAGGWEAQAWPMAKGLISRAYDDPSVQEITARIVYEGEHFDPRYGTNDGIDHIPNEDAIAHGVVRAAYAVLHMRGRAKFFLMYRSQLDAVMERSPMVAKARKDDRAYHGPWETDFPAMCEKTVLKRITKTAPLKSQRLFAALAVDDENDAAETIDVEPEAQPDPPKTKPKRTDTLKEKMAANAPAPTPTPTPEVIDAGEPDPTTETPKPAMITDEQKSKIRSMCDRGGAKKTGEVLTIVAGALALKDLESLSDLTARQADIAIDVISGAKAMRDAEAKAAAAGESDPSLGPNR